jgi:hypothetical protein
MESRQSALEALCIANPSEKVLAVAQLWRSHAQTGWDLQKKWDQPLSPFPGRPSKPTLKPPKDVPLRSVHTHLGMSALIHAVCHIEFNAINLALDAVWRFEKMPPNFYTDWLRVAYEESTHFEMLNQLLIQMDCRYGDFDAHDGLWSMCEKTSHDILARMALVPRTLEARGLDATPLIQAKLKKSNSPFAQKAIQILDVILEEEVGHVAIGNHWYAHLCEQQGKDPIQLYAELVKTYEAPKLKPPFNQSARKRAGFSDQELLWLES